MSAKPVRSFQSDQGSLHEQAYLARPFGAFALAAVYLMTAVAGCAQRSDGEVIVYTALDEDFSRPLLDAFTERTGVSVRARYDTESTKSVQLTQTILAERERPRCDVFWNNELVNTLRLAQAGELASYRSPTGDGYPEQYRSDESLWYGFAARARVLLVNTDLAPIGRFPDSILALTDPEWKDQAAIAKPLAGTTATHAACLFAVWGEEKAQEFFQQVKQNARVLGGNKQVARAVATGQVAFGLTDTDDAIIEAESGAPVTIVYPDQAEEELGTLFIP
ncbi:MAG: extracellular solute-binding protein, partial [Planctomycetota bacterium]